MYLLFSIILFIIVVVLSCLNVVVIQDKVWEIIVQIITILCGSGFAMTISKTLSVKKSSINKNKDSHDIKMNKSSGNFLNTNNYYVVSNKNNDEILHLLDAIQNESVESDVQNQSNIINLVQKEISNSHATCSIPNNTFIKRFFNEAKNICDKDIQRIWAELFVYESQKPNTITVRTLDILKNLTKEEATLFKDFSEMILKQTRNDITSGIFFHNIFKFDYSSFTKLIDVGLVKPEKAIWFIDVDPISKITTIENDGYCIVIEARGVKKRIECEMYWLTDAGCQLFRALDYKMSYNSFYNFAKYLEKKEPDFNLSLYKIQSKDNEGHFTCSTIDLLKR